MIVAFVFIINREDVLVGLVFLRLILCSSLQTKQGVAQERVPGE